MRAVGPSEVPNESRMGGFKFGFEFRCKVVFPDYRWKSIPQKGCSITNAPSHVDFFVAFAIERSQALETGGAERNTREGYGHQVAAKAHSAVEGSRGTLKPA